MKNLRVKYYLSDKGQLEDLRSGGSGKLDQFIDLEFAPSDINRLEDYMEFIEIRVDGNLEADLQRSFAYINKSGTIDRKTLYLDNTIQDILSLEVILEKLQRAQILYNAINELEDWKENRKKQQEKKNWNKYIEDKIKEHGENWRADFELCNTYSMIAEVEKEINLENRKQELIKQYPDYEDDIVYSENLHNTVFKIDSHNSKIGRRGISRVITAFCTHRGFFHSLLALGFFYLIFFNFWRIAALPFLIGYLIHLVLDCFTIRGVKLFYPLRWRARFIFKSGGLFEIILFIIFLILDCFLFITTIL